VFDDGLAKIVDAVSFLAGLPVRAGVVAVGFEEALDLRVLLLQRVAVEREVVLLNLVEHHQHRRLGREAGDQPQPVIGVLFLPPGAAVEHEQVQAAVGQEELVCGVHDLLPAKVPDILPHFVLLPPDGNRPLLDADALRRVFTSREPVLDQPLHKRRFPRFTASHQDQLGFVQRLPFIGANRTKVVIQNRPWFGTRLVFVVPVIHVDAQHRDR